MSELTIRHSSAANALDERQRGGRVSGTVYDAGALVAADRNDRRFWADHRVRLERDDVPLVPAGVVAQVSRSPRQVPLRRVLRGCDVEALDAGIPHRLGELLAASRTADVIDAHVVLLGLQRGAALVTSDRRDLERLLAGAGRQLPIVDV